MSVLTVANLLLLFAIVAYFTHSYFRNTADFLWYRALIGVPVTNRAMKYLYVHSFVLFVVSTAVFVASVVLSSFDLETVPRDRAVLALAVLLAAGALRLITMPEIGRWPQRSE